MHNILRTIIGTLYSILIGLIMGFLLWLFLLLIYLGIHIFWDNFILNTNSKLLILLVCLLGGLLVGICEKYIGKYPKTMEMVLKEYKINKSVEYKSLPKSLIKIFTVLWFGGTVGPEAALTGIIGGLGTFIGELLKYGFSRKSHSLIEVNSPLKSIVEIPLYGFYNFINEDHKEYVKMMKRILYGTIIISATTSFLILEHLDNKVSFITRFSKAVINFKELEFLLPLFIIGLFIAFYSIFLDKLLKKIFKPLEKYKILNSICGGIILGLLAITIPFILFSGEHTLKNLLKDYLSLGPTVLINIAIFKLLSSKICIITGWIGGPIFPIMFSSAAVGMACSLIFNINLSFAVAIIMSTALSGILKNYKLPIILLIFFFTFNLWIFIILSSILACYIIKKLSITKKTSLISR